MKRTPMKRGTSQLARTSWLAVRTAINPVSAKRARENRQRTRNVNAMRAIDPSCAMCGRADVPTFGHEKLGRAQGGDFVNPDVLLCNPCNSWCEDNPKAAAEQGWKISRKYPRQVA